MPLYPGRGAVTSLLPHGPQRAKQLAVGQTGPDARERPAREELDGLEADEADGEAVLHAREGGGVAVGAVDGEEGEGVGVCEADLCARCALVGACWGG